MTNKTFPDFTEAETLSQLDDVFSEHVARVHIARNEERELVAQLIALREQIKLDEGYVDELSNYISKYLKTSTNPEQRARVVHHFKDRYLKKFRETDYKNVVKVRQMKERIVEAKKFAAQAGFNPNSVRSGLTRSTLEKYLIQSTELPRSEGLTALQEELRAIIQVFMPRTEEEQKKAEAKRKEIENNLQGQVSDITKRVVEEMMGAVGLQNLQKNDTTISQKEGQVIDMNLEPKPG